MSEPVLLIGGNGSIGKRYQAILSTIKVPFLVYDNEQDEGFSCKGERSLDRIGFSMAIVCTPTPTHAEYLQQLIFMDKRFLCEKPLVTEEEDLRMIEKLLPYPNGFVVCNYYFLVKPYGPEPSIFYNYYNTGKDGLLWDCCQLIYLDNDCDLQATSAFWDLAINGRSVSYRNLEWSYVHMIKALIWNHGKDLWTLEDGVAMSKAVMERMKK